MFMLLLTATMLGCRPSTATLESSPTGVTKVPSPTAGLSVANSGPLPLCSNLDTLVPQVLNAQDITLTPPDEALPAGLAAYSGVWEGEWNTGGPAVLVVRSIDRQSANTTYIENGVFQRAMTTQQVTPDGSLTYSSSFVVGEKTVTVKYLWQIKNGTLFGERTASAVEASATIQMHHCTSMGIS